MAVRNPVLSLPNARPYPFQFPISTTALIIIDIQRDFVDPGGFGSIQCGNDEVFSKARAIVPTVKKVLDVFRSEGGHVIHTREGHQPDLADLPAVKRLRQISNPKGHHTMGIGDQGPMGRLLVRGEYGHDIVDELTPWPGETVIDKPGKGSFWGTNIHRVLLAKGITHLIFTGVTTECCVATTLRECNDRGYQCCVLEDCTQGFDAQQVTTSLDIICGQDGLFGFVGISSDFFTAVNESTTDQLTPPVTPPLLTDEGLPHIDELISRYKKGITSPVEIVNFVFDRIEKYEEVDPAVWIQLQSRESALHDAKRLAEKYSGKPLPSLYGIPFSVKDTIDVANIPTTAACPEYVYIPTTAAPAVQHVLDAGGIFIGKTNLDQLATGLSGCRSPYGTTHSVFSPNHISGGSSSGSSVSVGAKLVAFGLATDTAGSGRVPAAFNGIVGFKPTKGTVSSRGLVPACRTLDTITVVAPSVTDARKVWQLIAQHDPDDPFSKPPHTLPAWHTDFRGSRLGGFTFAAPPPSALTILSPPYLDLFNRAIQALQAPSSGGTLVPTDYTPLAQANHLLYDGALLHERLTCIGLDFLQTNLPNLHPVTRTLFSNALANPPSAYDVFRDQALQIQLTRKAQQMFDTLNGGVDVLIVPTTTEHPTIKAMEADPLALNSRLGSFTHYANVVDLCAAAVPVGMYGVDGEGSGGETLMLPFGVTVLGSSGFDAKVLDVAAVVEAVCREVFGNREVK